VLKNFVKKHIPDLNSKDDNFMCEFLLWGLSSYKKVTVTRTTRGLSFSDSFSDYINGL
jgi:magnesium chelatase subunit I